MNKLMIDDLKNKSGIYCIENLENNKKYIGMSNKVRKRVRRELTELSKNKHHNQYLQRSWNKYGEKSFNCYILEYCIKEELCEKEIGNFKTELEAAKAYDKYVVENKLNRPLNNV